jgi:DNA recombination protein RmuC
MIVVLVVLCALAVALLIALHWRINQQPETDSLRVLFEPLERGMERADRTVRQELLQSRNEAAQLAGHGRQELSGAVRAVSDSLQARVAESGLAQRHELELLRQEVASRLESIQRDNTAKLDLIRQTVDEKLQGTLERRLGESFKSVSERLEQVHRGFGEMQALAAGVGDLKRVLSNVKARGVWGEVQLAALLEQILTPDQFDRNVACRENSGERVEFAVRLPGEDGHNPVWLPIDAKFPQEDYLRLVEAADAADTDALAAAGAALEMRIKNCAKDIATKYLCPPRTTDFAILFLPTEGLYAEVSRRQGLLDQLQQLHVLPAGPLTLSALLNSLRMGFRTLAVQKRSSEAWEVLSAVKTEFGKFGGVIERLQQKLQQASRIVDQASVRTRAMDRHLRDVEAAPVARAADLLHLPALDGEAAAALADNITSQFDLPQGHE